MTSDPSAEPDPQVYPKARPHVPEPPVPEPGSLHTVSWMVPETEEFDVTGGRGAQNAYRRQDIPMPRQEDFPSDDQLPPPDYKAPDAATEGQMEALNTPSAENYTDAVSDNAILNMLHKGIGEDETSLDGVPPLPSPEDDEFISNMMMPASADAAGPEPEPQPREITEKQHQYLVDELNLARLYFETGDTDEAVKIVNEIAAQGSRDLQIKARQLLAEYGY